MNDSIVQLLNNITFHELINNFKSNNKHYDCVLGVSGGKDSTRQAIWLRDKFKLNSSLKENLKKYIFFGKGI